MEADDVYSVLNRKIKNVQASGGGVTDYADLDGKPQINGVTLQGNLKAEDLGLVGNVDYTDLENKPLINGVELDGAMSLDDLGIHNFSGNYGDLQDKPEIPIVPASLPNPYPVTFGGMLPLQSYDGSQPVNITFPALEIQNQTAGTPVGEILSYMGTVAPANYLICNGAVYNISEYPYLVQHFIDNFGSSNFFGGDGETTFAVPDLRGEFLRGTGTADRDAGSGAEVGKHQNATIVQNVSMWGRNAYFPLSNSSETSGNVDRATGNYDVIYGTRKYSLSTRINYMSFSEQIDLLPVSGSVRPTNTAVLYLIKYQPTYLSSVFHTYSFEERRIGTWVDGKPLYEKVVDCGAMPGTSVGAAFQKIVNHGIENVDAIWSSGGFIYDASVGASAYFISPNVMNDKQAWYAICRRPSIEITSRVDLSKTHTLTIVLHYTKTTD